MPKDGRFILNRVEDAMMDQRYATTYHAPILVDEVLELLPTGDTSRVIDCTLGGGGHSHAFLDRDPNTTVLGIDRDQEALTEATNRLSSFGERFSTRRGNYADVASLAEGFGPVDVILVDAGVSSHQLDDIGRGFSFREDGPLDMRMGDGETLADYLDRVEISELTRVIRQYGEIKHAKRIANAIVHGIDKGIITGTESLSQVIAANFIAPRRSKINPATLVFQALRIAINDELESLDRFLSTAPNLLAVGGRIGVISFHSLEDRRVKQRFAALTTDSTPKGVPVTEAQKAIWGKKITRKPVVASDDEVQQNPRARSAKFRVLERVSEVPCES